MTKRAFDLIVATFVLVAVSPLLAVVAILIKLDDGGPVFYRGIRIGRHGRPFRMLKFRTMLVDAERVGGTSTAADDPRVTRIGRWLRRFNLDELPQLIDVLRGEMSIVGPRPQVAWAVERYTPEERTILSVRPGITDWATIWVGNEGERLRGSADPDRDYLETIWPQKRRLQLEYVRHHSLSVDLRIILKTIKVGLIDRFAA